MGCSNQHQFDNYLSRDSSSIDLDGLEAMDCTKHNHNAKQLDTRGTCSNLEHCLATMVFEQLIISSRPCSGFQHRLGSVVFEQLVYACGTCSDLFVFRLGGMESYLVIFNNRQPCYAHTNFELRLG
jgi:hypothetical protein